MLALRARATLRPMEPRRAPGSRSRRLRPALEPLVRQLAELPEDERREVVAAAQEGAARYPVLSWALPPYRVSAAHSPPDWRGAMSNSSPLHELHPTRNQPLHRRNV